MNCAGHKHLAPGNLALGPRPPPQHFFAAMLSGIWREDADAAVLTVEHLSGDALKRIKVKFDEIELNELN